MITFVAICLNCRLATASASAFGGNTIEPSQPRPGFSYSWTQLTSEQYFPQITLKIVNTVRNKRLSDEKNLVDFVKDG